MDFFSKSRKRLSHLPPPFSATDHPLVPVARPFLPLAPNTADVPFLLAAVDDSLTAVASLDKSFEFLESAAISFCLDCLKQSGARAIDTPI